MERLRAPIFFLNATSLVKIVAEQCPLETAAVELQPNVPFCSGLGGIRDHKRKQPLLEWLNFWVANEVKKSNHIT